MPDMTPEEIPEADHSQNILLRVFLTSEASADGPTGDHSYIGVTSVKDPDVKTIRVDVPHTGSNFVDKLTIPMVDQGNMSCEFSSPRADTVHDALRQMLVSPPAPKLWWEIVYVPKDEDGAFDESEEVIICQFRGTIMSFPRTFAERQAIKGTLEVSLDGIPRYNPGAGSA